MRGNSQGYAQATNLSTAAAINLPNIPAAAITYNVIAVEGAGIRWRDDGIDPTSSIGMPVFSGQTFSYVGDATRLRIIGITAGATINVTYFIAS